MREAFIHDKNKELVSERVVDESRTGRRRLKMFM